MTLPDRFPPPRALDPGAAGDAPAGPGELLARPDDASPAPAERIPERPATPPRRRSHGLRLGNVLGEIFSRSSELFLRTPPGRLVHRRLQAAREVRTHRLDFWPAAAGTATLRVAFLSDLHAGLFMTARDLERLARRVMELEPDLVLLGGDLVDTRLDQVRLFEGALALLAPPLGTFAVAGNHEYHRPEILPYLRLFLEDRGVTLLENRGHRVEHAGRSLWLAGVDDLTEGNPDVVSALAGRRPDEPTLLLSHHPDVFREAAAEGVELQLSGHTHGGQIKLFGWVPVHHTRSGWIEGFFENGDSRLYVRSGTGLTALPIRIGTRSEISLFELG